MKKIIVIAVAAPLLAVAAEVPDSRVRAIVTPERIVASSDGVGGAVEVRVLKKPDGTLDVKGYAPAGVSVRTL